MSDREIIKCMRTYGGSFARCLATTWLHADSVNRSKIRANWPELWDAYETMARVRQDDFSESSVTTPETAHPADMAGGGVAPKSLEGGKR